MNIEAKVKKLLTDARLMRKRVDDAQHYQWWDGRQNAFTEILKWMRIQKKLSQKKSKKT